MKKQKKPGILHMLWKQCRPFMIIAPLMIVLFGTVSLVATLNPFLANTISTVLGGERRVLPASSSLIPASRILNGMRKVRSSLPESKKSRRRWLREC